MEDQLKDEIEFFEILKKIYSSRKIILYSTIVFLLIGLIVSLTSPIKFTSSTIFIPQNQEPNSSSLSGVASLVGINIGSSSFESDIAPSMYPKIGDSPKFKRLILESMIDEKNKLSLKKFLVTHYNIKEEKELVSSEMEMTKLEEECFKILSNLISINVNQQDGFVTITSTMPIAEYSATLAKVSREILQSIIIENKIETARQNLNFSKKQLSEKRIEFDEIQSQLAYFSETNLNTVNTFIINEKDKLEAEFGIINSVVTELSKQVEQAKLQVSKDTPVFSTIREVIIPNTRTSPKRKNIVFTYVIIGFVLSLIYILVNEPLKKILIYIKQN